MQRDFPTLFDLARPDRWTGGVIFASPHSGRDYPDWFLAATRRNAEQVALTDGGNGFCCTAQGFPFPLPGNGLEVVWNHIMRYNTRGGTPSVILWLLMSLKPRLQLH